MTYKEYLAKPRSFQDQWDRMTQVITRMRDGISLQQAAREFDISPESVIRLGRPALRRLSNGRYVAKPTDQLLRVLPIPGQRGLQWIPVTDSREAGVIGKYWDAIQKALRKGDTSALHKLRRKYVITETGERAPLSTDFKELKRLASFGIFRFESIYGRRA